MEQKSRDSPHIKKRRPRVIKGIEDGVETSDVKPNRTPDMIFDQQRSVLGAITECESWLARIHEGKT